MCMCLSIFIFHYATDNTIFYDNTLDTAACTPGRDLWYKHTDTHTDTDTHTHTHKLAKNIKGFFGPIIIFYIYKYIFG